MYLHFGFCEDIALKITFATESEGNPIGTLYMYFPYIPENLDDFFSTRLSSFGLDTVLILVSMSPGLIVITLMFVFQSSILKASVTASKAYLVAEYTPIKGREINPETELIFTIRP